MPPDHETRVLLKLRPTKMEESNFFCGFIILQELSRGGISGKEKMPCLLMDLPAKEMKEEEEAVKLQSGVLGLEFGGGQSN